MVELAEYKQRLRIPVQDTTLDRALAFHQARTLERRGQFDDAIAAYKKVLEYGPQDGVAYARLASLYVQRGLPRAAVMVYVALAEMHISRDRWEKAAAAYEKATELAPDDSDVHSALRDVYIRLGWLKEAAKVQARLDRILTEAPQAAVAEPPPPAPQTRPSPVKPDGAAPASAPPQVRSAPPAADRTQPAGPPAAPPEALRPPRRGQEPSVPAKDRPKPKEAASAPPAPTPPAPTPAAPGARKGMRARTESLGQILLDQGMVSREQLEKAIQMHQRTGGHLGRILVELGAVTEQQLAQALAVQWGLAWVDLSTVEIDPDVVKVIPQHLAQRHKVLAIEKSRKRLKMAVADPLNVLALDDVRLVTGLEIEPVVAAEADIVAAISRHYSTTVDLDEAMRAAVGSDLEVAEERTEELSVEKLRTLTEEAPVVRLVNLIISQAIADGASDIHIEPHRRTLHCRYRIDGVLHDVMTPPKAVQHAMVSRIKIMANMDIAERRIPQDGRIHVVIEGREYDLRVSTLPTVFGEKVVMRILDQSSTRLGLGKLGFTAVALETWEQLVSKPYGMVLVTGPTGSGKTTTLYSTLNKINTTDKNIITIEDPVEYQLARVNQVQVNMKAGLTFANGLRSFLRQDPDIIMVGEIRDRETAEIAIQASLTGHLVLSTVHTNDAPSATTRLIDMGIEPFLISSSLIGVLAQRLARTICSHCKESYVPPVEALHRLGLQPEEGEEIVFYRGRGCDRCKGSGYKGRIGIFELMVMSDTLRDLILKGASAAEIREAAIAEGMKTLREDGILKVLEGMTTVDELLRVVFVET